MSDDEVTMHGPIVVLEVQGMMCQKNCGTTVLRALEAVPGVNHAEVSFAASRAWVWTSSTDIPVQAILDAVEDVGFGVNVAPDVLLTVEGMMCQKNCGTTVKNALEQSPGVARAEASFAEGCGRVWLNRAGMQGGLEKTSVGSPPLERAELGPEKMREMEGALVEALECVGFGVSVAPGAVFEIDGMRCQKNCGSKVKRALEAEPGVSRAEVSFAHKRARVWASGTWGSIPVSRLIEAVESTGFRARFLASGDKSEPGDKDLGPPGVPSAEKVDELQVKDVVDLESGSGAQSGGLALGVFSVSGMSCASCVGNVEKFVSAVKGVTDVRVALLAEKAEVRFDPTLTDVETLADGIMSLGYTARHLSTSFPGKSGAGGAGGGDSGGVGSGRTISVQVTGIRGPECVAKIEDAVLDLPGVQSCSTARRSLRNSEYDAPSAAAVAAGDEGFEYALFSVFVLTVVSAPRGPLEPVGAETAGGGGGGGGGDQPVRSSEGPDAGLIDTGGEEAEVGEGLELTWRRGKPSRGDRGGRIERGSSGVGGGTRARGKEDDTEEVVYRNPDLTVTEALRAVYGEDGKTKTAGVRDIVEAIRRLGYMARLDGQTVSAAGAMEASQAAEVAEWRRMLVLAIGLTAPVMVLHATSDRSFLSYSFLGENVSCGMIITWILVTLAQILVGKRFYRNAYKAALHGSWGMDMLVVVGTTISYLYSTMSLLLACVLDAGQGDDGTGMKRHPHLFLESPAMLLSFVTLGKFLEVVAKRRTSRALVLLMRARPQRALLIEPGRAWGSSSKAANLSWNERSIDATLVQLGDVLKVLPGAKFPTDGTVLSGKSYVDESMVSGESSLVVKGEADVVCGGTINQSGSVLMRAERVGEDTMLAQLCRLVEEAQMSKAPIQRQADQVAGIFVPSVISASVVTFLAWWIAAEAGLVPEDWLEEERSDAFLFALLFGVSVVVVACPCALGLATPTAVMVGTGVGASNGILVKGGAALEAAHRVSTVVFDKTGTLTAGKPQVTDVVPIQSATLDRLVAYLREIREPGPGPAEDGHLSGFSSTSAPKGSQEAAVLAIAAMCEAGSEHPIGRSIVYAAASHAIFTSSDAAAGDLMTVRDIGQDMRDSRPRDRTISSEDGEDDGQSDSESRSLVRRSLEAGAVTGAETEAEDHGFLPSSGYFTPASRGSGAVAPGFVSEPGRGVACEHPLGRVCVGTRAWAEGDGGERMASFGVGGPDAGSAGGIQSAAQIAASSHDFADGIMRTLEEDGKTAVLVTLDGEALAVIAVADKEKEESRRAVLALQGMGLDVWIVTGDNRRVAEVVGRRLGIAPQRIMSEVLPAQKARKVQELQRGGGSVAMIGDGVNDAPALAMADLGIAVGAGTQVAMEAADVVLVRSDVCDVVSALHLSRKVFQRIQMNFVFAMVYNLVGVPVAAGALYPLLRVRLPPALAGLAMAFSSISVVLSSLSLRLYSKPEVDESGRLKENGCLTAARRALVRRCRWFDFFARMRVLRGREAEDRPDGRGQAHSSAREGSWVPSSTPRWKFLGQGAAVASAGSSVGPYSLVRSESGVRSKDSSDNEGGGDRGRGGRAMGGEAHGSRRHRGKRAARGRSKGNEDFGLDSGVELVGDIV